MVTDFPIDDISYVVDLGLIVKDPQLKIANPIYQEVVENALEQGLVQTAEYMSIQSADEGHLVARSAEPTKHKCHGS